MRRRGGGWSDSPEAFCPPATASAGGLVGDGLASGIAPRTGNPYKCFT